MAGRERRYALDTTVFIRATRDLAWQQELERFHAKFAPFEVLSAVVAQELVAGAKERAAKTGQSKVLEPFERRGRVIVPSYLAGYHQKVLFSRR